MKVSCKTYLTSSVLCTPNKTKNDLHMLHINSVINNLFLMLLRVNGNSLEGLFPPPHICCQACFFTSNSESFVA